MPLLSCQPGWRPVILPLRWRISESTASPCTSQALLNNAPCHRTLVLDRGRASLKTMHLVCIHKGSSHDLDHIMYIALGIACDYMHEVVYAPPKGLPCSSACSASSSMRRNPGDAWGGGCMRTASMSSTVFMLVGFISNLTLVTIPLHCSSVSRSRKGHLCCGAALLQS